ncbi:hypothetical protein E7Z59_06190 [Robertkochia marina]|uniref:Uncharacterized protein n=1 Tax=Robertkochia marina TaxID=1227945 RepID=A0A4S3M3Z8_9FLAO|nr:hypothetical protein [Robertkochia marina]THD69912.1 hypothetical protein E7Z59_06190 [Robertkochia marina]TRZ46740.1 hypothetical protein D3A96_04010 [Robertkochia marina]
MKHLFLVLFALIVTTVTSAQSTSLNDFQYVIVPRKYEFQRQENQHRLNTLTKFLLEKEGFEVYFEGQQPEFLANDLCKALKADLLDESGMLTTRVVFVLRDCRGNAVVTTGEGRSKIKEFEPSFHEAFKMAFKDIEKLNYQYQPSTEELNAESTAAVDTVSAEGEGMDVPYNAENIEETEIAVDNTTTRAAEVIADNTAQPEVLYAQPLENGFQLVDMSPAVRFKVRKTGKENTFAIVGKDGLLYKSDNGTWIAEYYENDTLVKETFHVKF